MNTSDKKESTCNNNANTDTKTEFETDESIKINVVYAGHTYSISHQLCRKIGFLAGMLDARLFNELELPLSVNPKVMELGHQVLRFMESNPYTGMNYLNCAILSGLSAKEYISQLNLQNNSTGYKTFELSQIKFNLAQVFMLLSLADYWDCKIITQDCTNFLALHLSVANPVTVKEWFGGII